MTEFFRNPALRFLESKTTELHHLHRLNLVTISITHNDRVLMAHKTTQASLAFDTAKASLI